MDDLLLKQKKICSTLSDQLISKSVVNDFFLPLGLVPVWLSFFNERGIAS